MARASNFSQEVRERAVRALTEHRAEYESKWAAVCSIAPSTYHEQKARELLGSKPVASS